MISGEDNELVARIVSSQDTTAFGELVRRHQSQVRNFLRKLTRDIALADDLSQDCFMHAWTKLHTYSGRGSFIGWLLKVAYTTFLQSKRKSKRYAEILEQAAHASEMEGRNYSVQSDEVTDLDKLLAVLNDEERAIIVMSYACGLSHREISDATSMPVGTVKSVIFRGKEKIRTSFDIKDHQYG
ncbi:MAG: RNA polymerase sigma factor [Gammaproteobacteria bacterium]|nr:RNA polymerase sigma factor [Gammaproteobacteria bacterium]MBU2675714.1 RNA polymerase sigma factor [Gammaproteobacteria bacterium]NNC56883.1 RNA polymerase sigma factor [Woeseiaceae bacterium]NNL49452.1 RNA polymerase sigma factor [Woeseiaceae bacterium]